MTPSPFSVFKVFSLLMSIRYSFCEDFFKRHLSPHLRHVPISISLLLSPARSVPSNPLLPSLENRPRLPFLSWLILDLSITRTIFQCTRAPCAAPFSSCGEVIRFFSCRAATRAHRRPQHPPVSITDVCFLKLPSGHFVFPFPAVLLFFS